MEHAGWIFRAAAGIGGIDSADAVLDKLVASARKLGATHYLITGLPMPNRPIGPLVLRMHWPELSKEDGEGNSPLQGDPILNMCLTIDTPVNYRLNSSEAAAGMLTSDLMEAVTQNGDAQLVAIPVRTIHPYQGCIVLAGQNMRMQPEDLVALHYLCGRAFRRMLHLNKLSQSRPGDLSARERRVLELTAIGKTANEIGQLLKISQRTVHAHLQNASEKLNASNKTNTVIEAVRYAQISI